MPESGASVVVATLDRPELVVGVVRDLLLQDLEPLEIVVVDQSAEVNARLAGNAREYSGLVRYLRVDFRGLARARNHGWRASVGDAVVFLDDDVRCGASLVREHLLALQVEGVGVVAGGVDDADAIAGAEEPARFSPWTAMPLGDFRSKGKFAVDHARGANFSARREALEQVGGFDEAFDVGAALYEELDFCRRVAAAGHEIRFNGRARVKHLQAPSGGCRVESREWLRGLAHNRARLVRRHLTTAAQPVALLRLALTGASQAVRNLDAGLLVTCLSGAAAGLRSESSNPRSRAESGPRQDDE